MANLSITSSLYAIKATSTVSTSRVGGNCMTSGASSAGAAAQTGDSASISPAGKLFSDLQALQQSDPAKFKDVLTDVANKLGTLSQQSDPASPTSQVLNDLSSILQKVADTGDLTQLLPAKGKHPAHHAHAQQQAAGGQQTNLLQLLNGNSSTPPANGVTAQDLLASLVQSISQAVGATGSAAV